MKFTLFLSLLSLSSLWSLSIAVLVKDIFDDSNPAIVYEPSTEHWFSGVTQECPQCPDIDMAINHSYHYGSHLAPPDTDDSPADAAVTNPTDPDAGPNDDANGQPDGDEHNGTVSGKGGGGDKGGKDKDEDEDKDKDGDGDDKRSLQRRDDPDDPGFVDTPVNATLTFNGNGVYVYCIVPIQSNNNVTNFVSNMTFTLDGVLAHQFLHAPSDGPSPQYNFSQLVFSRSNLSDEQHTLVISPLLGSMIMLDAINITSGTSDISSQNNTSSSTPAKKPSKSDVETFAVAIGSTTGVLAVLSFVVAASIYMRRRRSAKREKLREAQEESLRPEMRGPQPFIPRYFPGTTVASPSPSRSRSQLRSSSNRSTSVAVDSSISRRSSRSSIGPSHGLNYPLAPEIPAYSSVASPTITEVRPPLPISIALRAPVVRLPDDDDAVPPSYQEVGQTALLSSPVFSQQPAPSFSELHSPTRHPLILSSSEVATLEDDPEPEPESITAIASRLSGIPLILDDDDSNTTTSRRGAGSISLHRNRSTTSDGPRT